MQGLKKLVPVSPSAAGGRFLVTKQHVGADGRCTYTECGALLGNAHVPTCPIVAPAAPAPKHITKNPELAAKNAAGIKAAKSATKQRARVEMVGEEPVLVVAPSKKTSAKSSAPKSAQSVNSSEDTTMATKTARTAKKTAPKFVAKKGAKAPAKRAKKEREVHPCLCGCGAETFGRFAPGHDARLAGMIKRGEVKRLSAEQAEFAKSHGIKLAKPAK